MRAKDNKIGGCVIFKEMSFRELNAYMICKHCSLLFKNNFIDFKIKLNICRQKKCTSLKTKPCILLKISFTLMSVGQIEKHKTPLGLSLYNLGPFHEMGITC